MIHGTLGEIIESSVRNCRKKSREEIADSLGIGYSNFCRQLNPSDEGVKFGVESLIPLMVATGDYSPLEHIARRTGHLIINIRKLRVPKGSGREIEMAFQETALEVSRKLIDFFKNPTATGKEETLQLLDKHLGEAVATRKKLISWEQIDLPFE